jgi:transcriptional regulator with XRE-family HTH domain
MARASNPVTTAPKRPRKTSGRLKGINPVDQHVGMRVRQRRTLLGLSQEKLGEMLGLTFQQIQKYERGANRIGASRLYDIATVLSVDVGYFFEDMSGEVESRSPRHVAPGFAEPMPSPFDHDPMTRRETLELVRAYYKIENEAIRRRLLDLARSLSGMPDDEVAI